MTPREFNRIAHGFHDARKEQRRETAYFVSLICQSNGASITVADILGESREPGAKEASRAKRLYEKLKSMEAKKNAGN